ncbi:MAG: DUF5716 family protein [Eubacteriales bacterium]|nr:DUF5716 family protein [Eubacteriales bacterium]
MNETRDLIIGLDFGKENTQISYFDRKADEPVTISVKAGSMLFEMPTCLCKRMDKGDYCVGLEAQYFVENKDAEMIEDLYGIIEQEAPVKVGKEMIAPSELLANYLKGVLKFLGVLDIVKNTRCISVCMPSLGKIQISNFKKAFERLGYQEKQYLIMEYGESFYHYVFSQKQELWNRSVGWYEFKNDQVTFRKLSINPTTKLTLVRMEEPVSAQLSTEKEQRDLDFGEFVDRTVGTDLYSSIQITGYGFSREWAEKSVIKLCYQKRKVFFGNNLFTKGACAAGKERLEDRRLKDYCYVSEALVTSEVGMDMRIMGAPAYYPLLKAGVNWYESRAHCEMILDDVKELVFVVTPMGSPDKKWIAMHLDGLPKRPNKTTRISLDMEYISAKECKVEVCDLGFGELYPSSKKVWKETVQW